MITQFLSLVDTNTDLETNETDLWSPVSPASGGISSASSFFDFDVPHPSPTTDSDNNQDSLPIDNVLIDEKYLIFGDKLGNHTADRFLMIE